nr:methyltransferase domain-containing protein [Rubrobacteraceae bacterium]
GKGLGWHEHHHDLFEGVERFFRPSYVGSLLSSWIPALDGVEEKLREGAKVADIGCGHGASTILMAGEYPDSTFVGFDYHEGSIEAAREAAAEAGVSGRCTFEVASAKEYPGEAYDLVAVFDALHDMGDPVGAAAHVRESLAPDGTWMIVEPYAGDRLDDGRSHGGDANGLPARRAGRRRGAGMERIRRAGHRARHRPLSQCRAHPTRDRPICLEARRCRLAVFPS